MTCPRCWHVIGEHYYCRDHGGDDGFNLEVRKWKPKPIDLPPPEALDNLWHPWWRFLDKGQKVLSEAIP
jgi:hypothetical protein